MTAAPSPEVQALARKLAESEARLHTLIDRNVDGVVIVDEEGVVRFANAAAAALFSKEPAELVGHTFGFPLVTREATEIDVFTPGAAISVAEMRVVEITWEERPAYLASLRDVTARLHAEEVLRQKEEELRRAQRLEAVGRFAAQVTHEMHDVLMGVAGVSRVALLKLPPSSPAYRLVEEILRATDEGALVVRRVALLAEQRAPRLAPVELNPLVTELLPLVRRLVGRASEVTLDLGPALWTAHADEMQIEQILVTLATMARDASPGAGSVCVGTRNVTLDPADVPSRDPVDPGEYVLLEVAAGGDLGAGRAPRVEAMFTAVGDGGSGLGLAGVRSMVEASGGKLDVRAEPGRGARFLVYFPRAKRPAKPKVPHRREPRGAGETILVVDDEPVIRLALRGALEHAGYRVLEADGAAAARRAAGPNACRIDALVTDVHLPDTSGIELGSEIASTRRSLAVVYMTAFGESAALRDRVDDQHALLLDKPFVPEALLDALDALLAPADAAPGSDAFVRRATVLLVEEDDTARHALATLLGYRGHIVLSARTSDEALAHARDRGAAIDVVVTELALPASRMNGDDLARQVAAIAPSARVIFVSGFPQDMVEQRFTLPEGAVYLEKPVELDVLERRIDACTS
jgi:CheY-like chemotaxis protein